MKTKRETEFPFSKFPAGGNITPLVLKLQGKKIQKEKQKLKSVRKNY